MSTNNTKIERLAAFAMLVALLAGCSKPPAEVPTPADTAPAVAPTTTPPPGGDTVPSPEASPPDPAAPAPAPPPPTDPAPAPKPAAAIEPSVESMHAAVPSAKMSVAADLHYQFDGPVIVNQPVTLHLAAVPRVAGTNLRVSVKPVEGLSVAAAPLSVEKANAGDVYRQQLAVTRLASSPTELRVLVTMDMPEGTAFGFFSVPLDPSNAVQSKQESVKQR
jgi:hypothetical protein